MADDEAAVTGDVIHTNEADLLPDEIWQFIFLLLRVEDAMAARLVSRRFGGLANHSSVCEIAVLGCQFSHVISAVLATETSN